MRTQRILFSSAVAATAIFSTGAVFAAPAWNAPSVEPDIGNPAVGPDFDHDGFRDLAIGIPAEGGAGAVSVLYGTATGLSASRNQLWDQANVGVGDGSQPHDRFGAAVAWGLFDGDAFYDLAIGVPGEGIKGAGARAGVVIVLRGSATGLVSAGSQLWSQDVPDVLGDARKRDEFGFALVGRDFDGDKLDDLAIGIPGDDHPHDSGAVQVLYGSATGLAAPRNQLIKQPADVPSKDEEFGYAMGGGHLDEADLRFELVVSARDTVAGKVGAGAISVLYGTPEGVSLTHVERWTQDTPGVLGKPGSGDEFGRSLAIGDIDNDDNSDLAIGVLESSKGKSGFGAVAVLYGTLTGLGADRNQLWSQDSEGMPDESERLDNFGNDVTLADFDDDDYLDLAIGVKNESVDDGDASAKRAGAVHILYGTIDGLDVGRTQFWTQSQLGGISSELDLFGAALTRGDFNADLKIDLAIGVPGEGGNRGAIDVLYGTSTGLSATSHQYWDQDSADIEGIAEPGDTFGGSLMTH